MRKMIRKCALVLAAVLLLCVMSCASFAENDSVAETSAPAVGQGSDAAVDKEDISEGGDESGEVLTTGTDDSSSAVSENNGVTVGMMPDIIGSYLPASAVAETEETTEEAEAEPLISFVLLQKIAKIFDGEHNTDMWFFIGAAIVFVITLAVIIIISGKKQKYGVTFENVKAKPVNLLVTGAMCLSLAFVLSFVKLFSMPFGGSVTLLSMLPIMVYAAWAGPAYGFLTALAYAGLQVAQGAWIVHPVQFIFDYILGFTVLGLTSLFRSEKSLPVGILVAGFARMLCSSVAGLYYGVPEGMEMNLLVYALLYNFMCIGVETILCFAVYMIPPVRKAFSKAREAALGA